MKSIREKVLKKLSSFDVALSESESIEATESIKSGKVVILGIPCRRSFKCGSSSWISSCSFSKTIETSKTSPVSTHEHGENLIGIDSIHLLSIHREGKVLAITSHSAETTHVSLTEIWEILSIHIVLGMHGSGIVEFSLLWVSEDVLSFIDVPEHSGGFILLDLGLVSVSVRMVLECHFLVCFFDFIVFGIFGYSQNRIVIFFLGLLLFLFGLVDFGLEINFRIQFLNFGIILNRSWILSSFHVDFSPLDIWFQVIGVEFYWSVQVLRSFNPHLAFHVGKCSVGVNDGVKFLVVRVKVQGLGVLGLGTCPVTRLDELVAFLFESFALVGFGKRPLAFGVFWVKSDALSEISFSLGAVSTVQFKQSLEIHGFRGLVLINCFELSQSFLSVTSFCQTLDLGKFKLLVVGNLVDQIRYTRKRLIVVFVL